MIKPMPPDMSQLRTPARMRCACALTALSDTTASAKIKAFMADRRISRIITPPLPRPRPAALGITVEHHRLRWNWPPSPQPAAEPLDAAAGLLQIGGLGGVGNPERRTEPKGRALHDRNALRLQELGHEVLVGFDPLARRGGLADGALAD